ncbi:MAG: GNAT family N-acetyltransferase [Flavobacterium sp.]|jgi:GNAT superfamily N-acetyltransferase|uniref:GNAT family N-acetyltransferase n=1 Tax=Flavobacterium algoritolerans TaxID=3041254 RepID=A0ABT6V780_9FLAO|nr:MULTISPECIES: GNAT family N-acetyltransferase [Flavobacterium]MDI5894083.1 GNAT family N-acetyltransferase [Flavobacterium algoritolerans]MDI6048402.1 GNAT family N-acetyltransferase [Flavobacterium sp. XS2P24]MDP3682036.1 GNAT family N-acetyltransferase [Flavobacterium sp.]RKS15723.1 acetyltransferase (GNAT) family protein [Flavobacterium sp. 120]
MKLEIRELTTVEEMLSNIEVMRFLYPTFTVEKYESYLVEMIPHNYKQVAVFENEVCVAVSGFWSGTKLWSGKYIEIDNFIVHPEHRSKGLGKMMTDYVDVLAKETGCTMIVLDAFTGNFTAHRFYYNQGYVPKGFHFLKILNEEGLS